MRFTKFFIIIAIAISIVISVIFSENSDGKSLQISNQKARVQIQVIVDSSNSLQANVEVPVGTPARDLMDRLFKINYVDFTHRFVNGIAGFMIARGEKKFWRLEVDGKASEVGIAEIIISKPMQIRWVITAYK